MPPNTENSGANQKNILNRWVGKLGWKNLDKQAKTITVIVLFGVVGLGATLISSAAQIKDQETVVLDNGIEIRLGDSLDDLDRKIGEQSLVTPDKKIYQYPNPTDQDPIEVLIYTDGSEAVAIQIINGQSNKTNWDEVSVGETRGRLLDRLEKRRARLDSRLEVIQDRSYKYKLRRAASYYLFNPCDEEGQGLDEDDKMHSVALAYPEAEGLFGAHEQIDCSVEVD